MIYIIIDFLLYLFRINFPTKAKLTNPISNLMIRLFLFAFFSFIFSFSSYAQTKRVLIEEGTGTWCQWCPRGEVFSHQMMQDYDAIPIAVHSNDAMEIAGTPSYYTQTNITGLPTGNIDRTQFFVDPLNWEEPTSQQSNLIPAADIEVITVFDTITRSIAVTINTNMFSNLNGDYRIGAIVVEDAVTGPAPAYNQSNAYAGGGNGPMGGYELLASSIPASEMVYDHVARQLISDYQGDANSLPTVLNASNQYTYNLNWVLPSDQDEQYVYVVAYMTNATTGQIINANKSAYLLGNTNAKPKFLSEPLAAAIPNSLYQYDILCHDPDNDTLTISIVNSPNWLSVNQTAEVKATLSGTPTEIGIYNVELSVTDGENTSLQTYELKVTQNGGDWVFVGEDAFTSAGIITTDIAIDSNNIPFLIHTNDNDMLIVQKYQDDNWSTIGNPIISVSPFSSAIDLDEFNKPYLATIGNNNAIVYHWNNETWEQLGGNIGNAAGSIDISIANDGSVFVAYMDINNESKGVCKKWDKDNNNWITVGETNFNAASGWVAVWTKITTNSLNNPVVLYATSESSFGPYSSRVSSFDGENWNLLGTGNIDTSITAFNHSIAVDHNDKIYVSANVGNESHTLNVYTYEEDQWLKIGEDLADGAVFYNNIAVNSSGGLAVVYEDEGNGKTSVISYDGENWSYIGLPLFTNHSAKHAIAFSRDDIPFISYIDEVQEGKVSVKKYSYNLEEDPSDIKTNFNNQSIKIYPNPNYGTFTLEAQEFSSYEIIDMQGRVLIKDGKIKNKTKISAENLKPGAYFLHLKGANKNETIQFIRH